MAYRRRRNRGTWLPVLGTTYGETSFTINGIGLALPVDPTQLITNVVPLTSDAPTYQDNTASDIMGDVIGNEYFLDRIVGKLFVQTLAGKDTDDNPFLYPAGVAVGLFIARSEQFTPSLPIGGNINYNPQLIQNIREPWIWRRTWVLGGAGNAWYSQPGQLDPDIPTVLGNDVSGGFPNSNAFCGSVLDGPHIDAKTKRRVGQDDRLWLAFGTYYVPGLGAPPAAGITDYQSVNLWFDYRLHGALRKARPTGKF